MLTPHKATICSLTILCERMLEEIGMYTAKMAWWEFFVLTAELTGKPVILIPPSQRCLLGWW